MNNKIEILSNELMSVIDMVRPPAQGIPLMFLLCEILHRCGTSGSLLYAGIVTKIGWLDIPTGKNEDGSENIILKFMKIFSEEVVRALKEDAVAVNVIGPGKLIFRTEGGNVGGGTTIMAYNNLNTQYKGVIQ